MQEYLIQLSGYFITLFILLYTLLSFWAFVFKQEDNYKAIFIFQDLLMFAALLFCFMDISLVIRQKQ